MKQIAKHSLLNTKLMLGFRNDCINNSREIWTFVLMISYPIDDETVNPGLKQKPVQALCAAYNLTWNDCCKFLKSLATYKRRDMLLKLKEMMGDAKITMVNFGHSQSGSYSPCNFGSCFHYFWCM